MSPDAIYKDNLITITKNEIVFHNYYFPTGKHKIVEFENFKYISVEKPTLLNGK